MIRTSEPLALPHYHTHATEMTIILGGKMKVKIDGLEYLLAKNDLLILPPNTMYEVVSIEEKIWAIIIKTPSIDFDDRMFS